MTAKLTKVEYSICENQGTAFEIAANALEYSSFLRFVRVFMTSDFCNREIDSVYSVFQMQDGAEWIDFVYGDIGNNPSFQKAEEKIFLPEAANWIGYTYRQLAIAAHIHSRDLIRRVPLNDMMRMYPGYHTIDPEESLERIIEKYQLDVSQKED